MKNRKLQRAKPARVINPRYQLNGGDDMFRRDLIEEAEAALATDTPTAKPKREPRPAKHKHEESPAKAKTAKPKAVKAPRPEGYVQARRPMIEGNPNIFSANFVMGATSLSTLPPDKLSQIAFLGRSNVGKSSLLSALMGKKGLVKISASPGKTREMNLFLVNESFYFVDLPGIGYAKVSISKREEMGDMIRKYVEGCRNLRGIVYLVDMRHAGTPLDIATVETLRSLGKPVLLIANKRDKLSLGQAAKSSALIKSRFALETEPLAVSAVTRYGLDNLWNQILEVVGQPPV